MAVAFDAVGPSSAGATSSASVTLSWTHTASGSGVALVVGVAMGQSTSDAGISLSAKLDPAGANTTIPTLGAAVHSDGSTNGFIQLFGLPNVASGARTITVTAAGGTPTTMEGGSVTYTGADLVSPFTTQQSTTNNTANPTYTFTGSTAGSMVAASLADGSSVSAITSGTSRWIRNAASTSGAGNAAQADGAGGGSVTFTWTAGADLWAIAAVEVKAAAGAPTYAMLRPAVVAP